MLGVDVLISNLNNIYGCIQAFALQYKIVEEYERRPANGENFRFYLYPNHNYLQHNKLVAYNRFKKNFAGYVAPNFICLNDLYNNLNRGTLLDNSRFIPPQVYIIDKKSHYITFNNLTAHQHSREEIKYETLSLAEIIDKPNSDFMMSSKEFIDMIHIIKENNAGIKWNYFNEALLIAYRIIE
ncbi:MAG: hypothetical protein J1G05_06495 [Clostridiales bacterium]|nr:hypothetical protein [Clostridiales bacterium]